MFVHTLCMYSHTFSKSMESKSANPARSQLMNREKECFPVRVHACEFGLARRVRQSRPASACSSQYSGWIWCLLTGFLPSSAARRSYIHLKPSYVAGPVPSLSGHAIAYRWRSLPRPVNLKKHTRLPKCVMFVEMVGGAGCVGGQEKEWMGCFLDDLRAFGINADQWTTAAQDEGEWIRTAEQGAEHFVAKWIAAEKNKAGLRHAVICPNMTGRTKERIAQSKRARAGSLALID